MPTPTTKATSRHTRVTTTMASTPGYPYIEIGPAGTTSEVSTMMIQFNPNVLFTGNFIVLGRLIGQGAQDYDAPFVPISYRRWSLNNAPSDYTLVSDPIVGPAVIEVPANGITIALLNGLDAGTMDIFARDLQGTAAV